MSKLLEKYINQIDYSGNEQDVYASFIYSCFMSIGKPFEAILEKAEKENKKIVLLNEFDDEITIESLKIE